MTRGVKWIFFDCDNTLVLSEELAFETCAEITNEILASHKLDKRYTGKELLKEFVGQNFEGMLRCLNSQYKLALTDKEIGEFRDSEKTRIISKIKDNLKPTPGVLDKVKELYDKKQYKMAVVSSSAKERIIASLSKTGLFQYFKEEHVFSAASSLPVPTTKPNPAIYKYTMEVCKAIPEECVAIEDSVSGAKSAINAGIKVIGYLGAYEEEARDEIAKKLTNAGAYCLISDWSQLEEALSM